MRPGRIFFFVRRGHSCTESGLFFASLKFFPFSDQSEQRRLQQPSAFDCSYFDSILKKLLPNLSVQDQVRSHRFLLPRIFIHTSQKQKLVAWGSATCVYLWKNSTDVSLNSAFLPVLSLFDDEVPEQTRCHPK